MTAVYNILFIPAAVQLLLLARGLCTAYRNEGTLVRIFIACLIASHVCFINSEFKISVLFKSILVQLTILTSEIGNTITCINTL